MIALILSTDQTALEDILRATVDPKPWQRCRLSNTMFWERTPGPDR